MKTKSKKLKKIILFSLLGLFAAIILFLCSTLVIDRIKSKNEYNILNEKGYVNLISVGEYKLNVTSFGKEDGKHIIVAMAGLGCSDISVTMRQMTAEIEKENRVVFVDRA